MKLLPDNPTQFDYLHAIRAVASRCGNKQIFDLADAGMMLKDAPTPATEPSPSTEVMGEIAEILADNGYACRAEDITDSTTLKDLQMDSLDITRLVVECESRFGIQLDIEKDYPATVGEIVNLINARL